MKLKTGFGSKSGESSQVSTITSFFSGISTLNSNSGISPKTISTAELSTKGVVSAKARNEKIIRIESPMAVLLH
ncbi:hypothetical protein JXA84_04860 [candidate division WOR-3 bacterium]|nr:hypothetical protein [candidate division WOR-3 bacterium]